MRKRRPSRSSGSPAGEPRNRFPSRRMQCRSRGPARRNRASDLSSLRGRRRAAGSSVECIRNRSAALHFGAHRAACLAFLVDHRSGKRSSVDVLQGSATSNVPPGAEFVSDPLDFPVPALSDLAMTFHLDSPPARQTGHPGSRATSYYVHGDFVAAPNLLDAEARRPLVSGFGDRCACACRKSASIVALGDSITDGHGATTNGNDRWTDVLAQRLQGIANCTKHWRVEPGHRRESSADRRSGAECVGTLRSRCAGSSGRALGDRV